MVQTLVRLGPDVIGEEVRQSPLPDVQDLPGPDPRPAGRVLPVRRADSDPERRVAPEAVPAVVVDDVQGLEQVAARLRRFA